MKTAAVVFFLWVCGLAGGQTFLVDPAGGGDFQTIQEAIYAAWYGDTIVVSPGLYEEDITFAGRDLTLTSTDPGDPDVVASTVINGSVYFEYAETDAARLKGLTILSNAFNATGDSDTQEHPAVSWPWLLWTDHRNGSSNKEIYGRNLETHELAAVCTQTGNQEYPDIYGNLAVWQDMRNSNYDIYGKDLSTGTEIAICTNTAMQNDPAVYGQVVVWRDFRNSNYDIYGKNLADGNELEICTHSASQFNPDIYEDIVVWSDQRNSETTGSDIYGKNLTSGEEFEICTAEGAQTRPAVSGEFVVWRDERNGNYDLYGKNRTTGIEFEVCTLESAQTFFDLSGPWVVWQDNRTGNEDIYAKNLIEGEEIVISSASGSQTNPAIDGTIVAWQDGRTTLPEIYWFDLRYPACSQTVLYGIVCRNAAPVIENCTVLGCVNYGIVGMELSAPTLLNNTIQYNYDAVSGCNGLLENNLITNNEYGVFECNGIIRNNHIAYNKAYGVESCGGLIGNNLIIRNHQTAIVNSDGDIVNNTLAFNGGGGLANCGGLVKNNILAFNQGIGISGVCENRYNAFWQNEGGSFDGEAVPGIGSIVEDPHFADADSNDYHLLSEAGRWDPAVSDWVMDERSSRCIDLGDPADDTQLELNPHGGRINLGAYGGTIEASQSTAGPGSVWPCIDPPSMDSNGDCMIDLTDLAAFCSQWLVCGRQSPDGCRP